MRICRVFIQNCMGLGNSQISEVACYWFCNPTMSPNPTPQIPVIPYPKPCRLAKKPAKVAIMFEILLAFTVEAYIELREALHSKFIVPLK